MKKIILILFSFSLLFLVGCLPTMSNISLSFGSSNLELEEGKTYQLLPMVVGVTDYQISYSEYDDTIITVSATGEVVALKEGITSIKATLVGHNISANVVVIVNPSSGTGDGGDGNDGNGENVEKDYSIVVQGGLKEYQIGEVVQLQFKENNEDYDGLVTWISTNPSVATVTNTGLVVAVGAGSASITAVAIYGNKMVTVNIIVAANDDPGTDPGDDPGDDTPGITPIITALTISGDFILDVGEISQLTVTPDVNLDFAVTWSSEDTEVATVDQTGKVTGVAAGIVNIVATLKADPTIYAKCTIVVRDTSSSDTSVTGITLSGTTEVLAGSKIKLTHEFTPSDATGAVLYSSENQTIATVDQNGWVTGVAGGNVKITVTLVSNPDIFDSVSVKVIGMPSSISITGNKTITVGATTQLTATVNPSTASQAVSWTSSNTGVATVSATGLVTAKAAGTTTITVTSIAAFQVTATYMITVVNAPTITISDATASIIKGETKTLTATVLNLTNTAVNWTSNNVAVATVDSSGKVTAVATGTATITATAAGNTSLTAVCVVTVVNAPAITISDATASIIKGQTKTLTATVSNLTNTAVTWTSSNTSVATVSSSGVVTAVAAGSATITATSVANTALKATCAVTVTNPAPTITITLAIGKNALVVDEQTKITPTITGTTNYAVTYSTSSTAVALVSSSGVVTAKGIGSATITVSLVSDPTIKATVNITVAANTYPAPGTKTGPLDLKLLIGSSPSIILGQSIELTITGATSRYNYNWSSSNTTVATVGDYGKVDGKSVGYATITAVLKTDSSQRGTYAIKVYEDYSAEISILYSGGSVISVGSTTQLSISSTTGDTNVTWTSSDTGIATISSTGLVTGVGSGTAVITANLISNPTIQATAYIIVGSGNVVHHTAVFNWLEQYLVSRTLSRNVLTYGNTTKTEETRGSVSYFWPGTHSVNTEFYGRYHQAMSSVWYVVIHHTGNNNVGAGARNTASYCSTADVSIHYCVDANSVYSVVKESSVAWHAGDGTRAAGSTYYNTTYGVTCITGGNMNGIGIEMCQHEDNDLYMTWHRTAKLTADILMRYSLATDRVKQHNHFMGKNCPQELRESGLYTPVFAKMVKAEYQYRKLYSGYTISFSSGNPGVINNYGHVVARPSVDTVVSYTVTISKSGITESKTYTVTVPLYLFIHLTI
ncbi:MAG: Ig-like domain-containing protein [Bacilli bacterium]